MMSQGQLSLKMTLVLLIYSIYETSGERITDKFCVSGSSQNDLNGMYEYLYWDSTVNGAVFYNNIENKYLYPYISSNHQYLISGTINSMSPQATCNILNPTLPYTFTPNDCIQNWQSDTNMRLVNCNDICIRGSAHSGNLNGRYVWNYFEHSKKGSVYFCQNCSYYSSQGQHTWDSMYLHPYIYPQGPNNGDYDWHISPDYLFEEVDHASYCELGNVNYLGSDYIFNLNDCTVGGWITYLGDDNSGYNLVSDPNMITPRCVPTTSYSCTDKCYYYESNETTSTVNNTCIDDCDCQSTQTCNAQNFICEGVSEFYQAPSCVGPPTPSPSPTSLPTQLPTRSPTNNPSLSTLEPSNIPSYIPSTSPTETSNNPSQIPFNTPSQIPSDNPSRFPSNNPSNNPTKYPSNNPSRFPSNNPSQSPSNNPTKYPSNNPSQSPSNNPSQLPSNSPTVHVNPTKYPSFSPSSNPITHEPTNSNDAGQVVTDSTISTDEGSIESNNSGENEMDSLEIIFLSSFSITFVCCIAMIGCIVYRKGKTKAKAKQKQTVNHMSVNSMPSSPDSHDTIQMTVCSIGSTPVLVKASDQVQLQAQVEKTETHNEESQENNVVSGTGTGTGTDHEDSDSSESSEHGMYGNSFTQDVIEDSHEEGYVKQTKMNAYADNATYIGDNNIVTINSTVSDGEDDILNKKQNDDHQQQTMHMEYSNSEEHEHILEEDFEDVSGNMLINNVLNNGPDDGCNDNMAVGDNLDFIQGIMIYDDDMDKNIMTRHAQ